MKPLLLFLLVILFAGCRKIIDVIKRHEGNYSNCQIHTVSDQIVSYSETIDRIATCNYNKYGNPESVTYNRRETGFSWFFFKYDKYQRLTEFKDDNFVTHYYVYEGFDHKPVRDTMVTTYQVTFVEYFSYDTKGRIIKVKRKFIKSESGDVYDDTESNYAYNDKGNLVGDFNYDDKVSIYSTNWVWMFIHRNYSVNNLAKAETYNTKGLPLNYDDNAAPSQNFFLNYLSNATVTYTCSN